MTLKEVREFIYYLQGAGFTTMGEVYEYMQVNKMTAKQLARKVRAMECTFVNGKMVTIAEFDAFSELIRRGVMKVKARNYRGMICYETM